MADFKDYSPAAIHRLRKRNGELNMKRGQMSSKDSRCGITFQERIDRNYRISRLTPESAESIQELLELTPTLANRMYNDAKFRKRIQEISSIYNLVK